MKKTDLNNNDSKKQLTFREIFDLVQKNEEINREIQMKIDSLNNNVKNINEKSTSKKQPYPLNYMLVTIFNMIQRFEKDGDYVPKNTKDKIDTLKIFVTEMIKYEENAKLIMGEKIIEERPFVSKYKNI